MPGALAKAALLALPPTPSPLMSRSVGQSRRVEVVGVELRSPLSGMSPCHGFPPIWICSRRYVFSCRSRSISRRNAVICCSCESSSCTCIGEA
eukprot:366028-Chlamydomonas_euryale.AAC.10